MNVADKSLTMSANNVAIAENQPKVYDAGHKAAVNRYCPDFIETDSIVTCKPVGGYPLGIISQITPIQAGSGDASPTNIRPLSAHATVKVTRCGENMLDISRLLEATGWAVDENGVYYGDTQALYRKFRHDTTDGFLKGCFKTNTRYTIMLEAKNSISTAEALKTTIMVYVRYTDGSTGSLKNNNYDFAVTTFTTAANKTVEKIGVTYSSIGTDYIKQFTVCEGEVATTDPYRANNYTAEFGQNVYAGNFDWSTGLLTLTHKMLTLTGNESWNMAGAYGVYNGGSSFFGDSVSGPTLYGYCSHVQTNNKGQLNWDCVRKANSSYGMEFAGFPEGRWGEDLLEITVAKWKEYTKAQYDAGTPIQIAYELATPLTVQLTAQEILALDGTNTVYSDTGDTTVTFKADPIALVAQLEESIISLGGDI